MKLNTTHLFAAAALCFPTISTAQNFDDVVQASLLTGWRQSDGSHMAAIKIDLEPGWHTYWRAPGDAGIPPTFNMQGSQNFKAAQVVWPRPQVYQQNGLRSIVYHDHVVLPLQVMPKSKGSDISLSATIDIGVCNEICIPQTLTIRAILPANSKKRDPSIAAALADRPFSGAEAGARNVTCSVSPSADGITLKTSLTLPKVGQNEAMVIETANPLLWVAEPQMTRSGKKITATTEIQHVEGAPFMLNRSRLRITLLGESRAVEVAGCKGS
ncbi:protein-disulfide reductase DsbD domain-containing protein [Planktotalea sp.]|uniref:protein-disulfide reductase DsbD domain-containing protein n=1 Tax=Planktotalea sp. TaxID=2029877 RepID=UPI003D6C31B4